MDKIFKPIIACMAMVLSVFCLYAQESSSNKMEDPLIVIERVGDKIIRETPFEFQLKLRPNSNQFDFVQHVDFGRTFGLGKPGIAYALSQLESRLDTSFIVQVSHNDGLVIWINGQEVYKKEGSRKVNIKPRERDIGLESECKISLKKGINKILVKSQTQGNEWIFYLQPKGALIEDRMPWSPTIGLTKMPGVDSEVAKLTNWLVMGPFEVNTKNDGPEKEYKIGKLYWDGTKNLTWTIPKIEVFADVMNPKPFWGTYYNWNYHTGGVAWAMANLSEASGRKEYGDYANKWTDFMLEKKPFIGYQVNEMNGFQSTHHQLFNTPLLDFTAAPALPFIYRLAKHSTFDNRKAYKDFVDTIKQYVIHQQIRLPQGNFTRETPKKFTTWADDMYMGIPFIIQAALETSDPKEKEALLNDAANQILAFNSQVFDTSVNLYQHAQYSTQKAKLPYWSRANGWGIWATTEVLLHLPENHPLRKQIMAYYLKHVAALIKLQDERSGGWHNVLDRRDSYLELSGTAILTMAIARGVNNGWLKSAAQKAAAINGWKYITSCIETNGTVHNICVGTMSSENVDDYMTRPKIDDDSHGILGLIFAGIEMHKLLNFR